MPVKNAQQRSRANESSQAAASSSRPLDEMFGLVLRAAKENRNLFPNEVTRVRLFVSLASGDRLELEVDGFETRAFPIDREAPSLAYQDPSHLREDIEAIEASADIDSLNLGASAKAAAKMLLEQFPSDVKFTSGRRTVSQQASAMAGNVMSNRKYIEETYKASSQRDALQKWVNDNPSATTQAAIAKGLEGVMNAWTIDQQRNFSRHMTGDAFDVQPVTGSKGKEIKEAIGKLPKLNWKTFTEAGLEIWHAQFDA